MSTHPIWLAISNRECLIQSDTPQSGAFETVDDLSGQLIVGNPDQVVEEVKKFEAIGVNHLVFDFRFKLDQWFEQIELLGKEVLPHLNSGV